MSTLLLKINPPLQSWGVDSKFYQTRSTSRYPSKSGVIGMICAALGWDRTHDLSALRKLRMGVRIDQPGRLEKDYHTAAGHLERDGVANLSTTKVTERWYLADAAFIVGLESTDTAWLNEIAGALADPRWNMFAGRKSCPVNYDLVIGVVNDGLEDALSVTLTPLIESKTRGSSRCQHDRWGKTVECIIEGVSGDDVFEANDDPLSFDPGHRLFAPRTVSRLWYSTETKTAPTMDIWGGDDEDELMSAVESAGRTDEID